MFLRSIGHSIDVQAYISTRFIWPSSLPHNAAQAEWLWHGAEKCPMRRTKWLKIRPQVKKTCRPGDARVASSPSWPTSSLRHKQRTQRRRMKRTAAAGRIQARGYEPMSGAGTDTGKGVGETIHHSKVATQHGQRAAEWVNMGSGQRSGCADRRAGFYQGGGMVCR